MKKILFFCSIFLFVCFYSCSSKKLTSKAIELENAGLFQEAAEYYFQALTRKRDNIEAQIGLKRNGQKVLDGLLQKFHSYYTNKDYQNAVYQYIDAQNYEHKVQSVNVMLNFPTQYNQAFIESKGIFLEDLYKKGTIEFQNKNYAQSERIFNEIVQIDDMYKDSQQLLEISIIEPMYINGRQLLSNTQYKKAYFQFDEISRRNANYKDVQILKDKALQNAQLSIVMLPVYCASSQSTYAQSIAGQVYDKFLASQNPFIKVIDRTYSLRLLEQQKINLSPFNNFSSATGVSSFKNSKSILDIGKLVNAKSVWIAKINLLSIQNPMPKIEKKIAYIQTQEKVFDETTKMQKIVSKYTETEYSEIDIQHNVSINFDFQLISTETGEILASEVINHNLSDHVHFAKYTSGDYQSLSPNPNNTNLANEKMALHEKFRSRSDIRPIDDMIAEILSKTSTIIVNDVLNYENSRP